ncbi:MarR family winged helix-turn-helix transcriptional regulator [Cellulomonas sp. Leaf334]|uniref:MarR family winged helix-turn-helix transcriptional regulator n=1 Tax=Cellulomonas sp. Leaf334 TaxID=1736339 RepID=UPI00138ED4CD|nr:MarR family winged helix-turn-helix transcriptional regulator [Cellulomonas sp. Leaf334]
MSEQLDQALLRLRRFFEPPRQLEPQAGWQEHPPVDLSTLLVVEALLRGGDAVSIGKIARDLGVAHSTASRFVDRAVSTGMAERTARDSRQQGVRLTTNGETLAERARMFRWSRLDALISHWDRSDQTALATLLTRFADEVDDAAAGVDRAVSRDA